MKQNLHIHTTYSDGKDSPEEIILKAIEKGFDCIVFSEHTYNAHSVYPYYMIVGKIISGISAIVLAMFLYKDNSKKGALNEY